MKKLLAIMLALGLSCSLLTSCSKDEDKADKEETKQEEVVETEKEAEDVDVEEEEEEAEEEEESEKETKKEIKKETKKVDEVLKDETELEAYINDNKSDIEALEEQLSVEGMEMKISAEGNSLVYECTITSISEKDVTDDVIDAMKAEMAAQEDTLKGALEMIQTEVPSAESIIYRYYDKNGVLIYDAETK